MRSISVIVGIMLAGLSFVACMPSQHGVGSFTPPSAGDFDPSMPSTFSEVQYARLASPAFAQDFADEGVIFHAMFIGEFGIPELYEVHGMWTKDRVFINHRDVTYTETDTGLAGVGSDVALPPFALSIAKEQSDIVYELKRGDIIKVTGLALYTRRAQYSAGTYARMHVVARDIEKVEH